MKPLPRAKIHSLGAPWRTWAVSLTFVLLLAAPLAAVGQDTPQEGEWISLFNGKDLSGWIVKIKGFELNDNHANTFRVEDGLLRVAYDQYQQFDGKFGHLFHQQKFSNYRLRVDYRFVGKQTPGGPGWALRNSGIMIHSQSPGSMRKDQDFPVSVEVQLLGGDGKNQRPTANMCSPGTHVVMEGELITLHCVNSRSKTFHGDQWVTVELEVRGNALIRHLVNGEPVMEYSQPQLDDGDVDACKLIQEGNRMLTEGYISLQAESHPVDFRKVEILPLPASPATAPN